MNSSPSVPPNQRRSVSARWLASLMLGFLLLASLSMSGRAFADDGANDEPPPTPPAAAQNGTIFLPLIHAPPTQTATDAAVVAYVYFDTEEQLAHLVTTVDVWEEAISDQNFVTTRLYPDEVAALRQAGYRLEIDETLTAQLSAPPQPFGHSHSEDEEVWAADIHAIPGYSCYRTVEETYTSMAQLVANNPTLATWTDIGDSYDKVTAGGPSGYDLYVLKLTNSAIAGPKPKLMIIAAIHAREYTTAELASRFAEYLISNYGIDADATWLLDYNEIHIVTQANPDGRKIAEGGQLWRKNTNPSYGCSGGNYGVDLNRNSSFQWGGSGSSGNTCSQTYRGPSPASEVEVQAIQNYAASIFPDQRGPNLSDPAPSDTSGVFISLHSYGELVLYPWGWSNNPSPNNDGLATLGRKFGFFNGHEVCNDCLYIADGTTDDWTYGELGVASYTFELGTEFFEDCSPFESQILPDNLPALVYAAKAARRPYQDPAGPDAVTLSLSQPIVASGDPVDLSAVIDDTRSDSNGQGSDPTHAIQAARYSIGTPSWAGGTTFPMSAADGSFNSTIESVTATIDTTGLSNGQHIVFVEGQDVTGQWGVTSALFLEIGTPPTTLFFDDFESSQGWTTDPNGTDTATTGMWEVGDPQDTNSNGPKQLGTTFSGSNDLVTQAAAGSSVGTYDIDNGETSVRSPDIAIPAGGDATLSFAYYMAHTSNSSTADYLRVKVVGTSTSTVLEELGAGNDDDGAWELFSTDISAFAGQTVYLLVEAADAGNGSIVEAALDDVRITSSAPPGNQPPTADAGPDQTVTDSDDSGAESITLDGSGSSDSDGTIVSYQWSSDSGVTIPDGVSPTASFSVGVHTVTLTVTDDEGAVDTDDVIITINAPLPNQPPTADAGPDQTVTDGDDSGAENVTLDGSGSSDSDGTIVSYQWSSDSGVTIPDGVSPTASFPVGVHNVTLTVTDNEGAIDTDGVVITVEPPQGGVTLETGVVTGVGNSGWTTVNLANSYSSMVVVASANYDNGDAPGAVRIRNATGNSFDVRVDNTDGTSAISGVSVHYVVVEEGVYTEAEHGVKMEAVTFLSTVTDENNSWVGESRSYSNSYSSPVVLGQVMSYNDADFSTFWSRGSNRNSPPSSSTLYVGKNVGEDSDTTRADETIGYIVIEAGSGAIGTQNYSAGLGADTVRGVTNSPPYNYTVSGLSSASTAIVSQAAMDGNNGGWAILYGANPVSGTTLQLAIDEDQAGDSERSHTHEQVGYLVFE